MYHIWSLNNFYFLQHWNVTNSTTLPRFSFMGDTITLETFIINATKKGKWRGNLYNHEIGQPFIESEEIANLIQ